MLPESSKRSSDAAQRNPGFPPDFSWIPFHFIQATLVLLFMFDTLLSQGIAQTGWNLASDEASGSTRVH